MISAVITAGEDERGLAATLSALVPAAIEGVLREVVVLDAAGSPGIATVADAAGCSLMACVGPLGQGLRRAAGHARGAWLLFLPAGIVPEAGWPQAVADWIEGEAVAGRADRAGIFRHARAGVGWRTRAAEASTALAALVSGLPGAERGLLLSAAQYRRLGGHRPLDRLAHHDLLRRIGRQRLARLPLRAIAGPHCPAPAMPRTARFASTALVALGAPPPLVERLVG